MRKCCICDNDIYFGFNYLCKDCWKIYKDQINEPWLRMLMSSEQKEREYRVQIVKTFSLEEILEQEYYE